MQTITIGSAEDSARLYRVASLLAVITIAYNIVEGLISVGFGFQDETIALLGFGLDSFVEVISGVGILHMIMRIRSGEANGTGDVSPDRFEATALRITGTAFYLLFAGLLATAAINVYTGQEPETTFWGVVVSSVSIVCMWLLMHYKVKVGRALKSDAILADANCTKVCFYLSIALLVSSLGFELTGIGWFDSAGAVVIAIFALREGRESFDKAHGKMCSCAGTCKT